MVHYETPMCLILFAFKAHPGYKLILAANRDEFYNRPTAPAGWWEDHPDLLAGKDLKAGGTWLGITKKGRIAAVTNYRGKGIQKQEALSRGTLVRDYLISEVPGAAYSGELIKMSPRYNGFNLIFGDVDNLYYYSSMKNQVMQVQPGIHGLSNAFLDTPWVKVVKGKQALEEEVLKPGDISMAAVFDLLKDTDTAPDDQLPDTGIGTAYERLLSPLFIRAEGYGTRSSTLLLVDQDNQVRFIEKSFIPRAENSYTFHNVNKWGQVSTFDISVRK